MDILRKQYLRVRPRNYNPNSRGDPIGCVVSKVENGNISFGFSLTNPLDRFNKATANHIANQRLNSGLYTSTLNDFKPLNEVIKKIPASLQPIALKMALWAAMNRK